MSRIWAIRRRIQYGTGFVIFLALVIGLPIFFWINEPVSCFDSKQNGREAGIDCGGACQKLCLNQVKDPVILWSRAFRVTPSTYNLAAIIENQNVLASVEKATYILKVFDDDNELIGQRVGITSIPSNSRIAIFESRFGSETKAPSSVTLEFEPLDWQRGNIDTISFGVEDAVLSTSASTPRVNATVKNEGFDPLFDIEAVAIVYDGAGNPVGASQTFIDEIPKRGEFAAVFTWPLPFETGLEVCEAPVDVALALDRSGSMEFISKNPPQPLADVKNAALSFISRLKDVDQASVVSFATTASSPVDQTLSDNSSEVRDAIRAIGISKNGTQHTNLADGLQKATSELSSFRHRGASRKVIVILTDGVATRPLPENIEETEPVEPSDPAVGTTTTTSQGPEEKSPQEIYAEGVAISTAQFAKQADIEIYTIGLGKDVNESFLMDIASQPSQYYNAATARDLTSIYEKIAASICKKRPTVVEVIPRLAK